MSNSTRPVFGGDSNAVAKWQAAAAMLKDYRDQQRAAWGDLDDVTVAKYLANEATDEEIAQVEAAMEQYPTVRQAIELVKGICDEEDKTEELK